MTKAPIPTEMAKGQSDNTNNATKKFDYTAVADRLWTVSCTVFTLLKFNVSAAGPFSKNKLLINKLFYFNVSAAGISQENN